MCQICGQPDNIRCNCQVSQPYCDQCGDDNTCEEKINAECVFFHFNCINPAGLPNLGITCNTDLKTILETLDDLVGNHFNIPFQGQDTSSIRWVANGPAGHKPYAHVKISEDEGNIAEVREDGLYVPETECDCPEPELPTFVNSTNDCITNSPATNEEGEIAIVPSLDFECLLSELLNIDNNQLCQFILNCLQDSQPSVVADCEEVEVFGNFELGVPSSGFVKIPVVVTDFGQITATIQNLSGNIFGTISQFVNAFTTFIIVPISYNGLGSSGTNFIDITIFNSEIPSICEDVEVNVEDGETCVDVTVGEVSLLNAVENSPYLQNIPLSGTAPFAIDGGSLNIPSWMSANIVGSNLVLSGTPTDEDIDTDVTVSVTVTNCSEGSDTFSDTIDVLEEEGSVNFTVVNNGSSCTVIDIEPSFFYFTDLGVPLTSGNTATGVHGGYSGNVAVTVNIGGTNVFMKLYVDNVLMDCVAISSSGVYNFLSVNVVGSNDVEIRFEDSPC